jgi:molybdopterin converting factor subunit 1
MEVKVLLFAGLREVFEKDELSLALNDGACARELIEMLSKIKPELSTYQNRLNIAVNQDLVGLDHVLGDSDEIAVFPPVGGG